jgi:hypothetical protein
MILGCGPAGLISAHAASSLGAEIAILSKNRKSFMKGAQYLHEPVLGITKDEPFNVTYNLWGSEESYRMKVYGRNWDGEVSPGTLTQSHQAWDIRQTYDTLWDTYSGAITDWEASTASLNIAIQKAKPDLVISSIPSPLLCNKGHTFRSENVWATDRCMVPDIEDNTVVCNGVEIPRWYRASKIQGWGNTEWPSGGMRPPFQPMWDVVKPLEHNCTCFPGLLRVGRYGAWKKGILSHEAFQATIRAMEW